MTYRDDHHTTTPQAAATWERHHTHDPLPPEPITPEDAATYAWAQPCGDCGTDGCWVCQLRKKWAQP